MSRHTLNAAFQRVILGIDGYGRAAQLAPIVAAIAPNADRTLVCVYAVLSPTGEAAEGSLREEALAMLASERINAGLPDAQIVAFGDRDISRGLQRAAADCTADLLVIGPSGRSPRGQKVFGEVGTAIFQGAACPVLVSPRLARSAPDRPQTIGVAFDGSPESTHALALADALAATVGARLEVVRGIDVNSERPFGGTRDGEYRRAVLQRERQRLQEACSELASVPRHTEVAEGATRVVLDALAQRVDVLFCGSRGWGPAARMAFGSTAAELMHDARCPVVVVGRSAQRHDRAPLPAAVHADSLRDVERG